MKDDRLKWNEEKNDEVFYAEDLEKKGWKVCFATDKIAELDDYYLH